ncbi:MAG: D-ribose pyranase [Clostridia bacterium]|nr:D-ribose pyranase [Clostridia bacterium]
MKRSGLINRHILFVLASLGHGDCIAIADCGLPIPKGVRCVDLAIVMGVPSFQEVVRAVAEELIIQRIVISQEMRIFNSKQYDFIKSLFRDIPVEEIPHVSFKEKLKDVKAVIRTGEATPYSNVIFESGVAFR